MTLFMTVLFSSILTGCGEKETDTAEALGADPASEALWSEIQGFDTWSQYPGWEGVVASESVHGDFVSIWLNDSAMSAVQAGETVPDGGILVKQTFVDAEGSELKDITVMKKVDGFDPDGSDWYWGQYLEDGSVENAGNPAMCTGCHASGDDYIRFTGE